MKDPVEAIKSKINKESATLSNRNRLISCLRNSDQKAHFQKDADSSASKIRGYRKLLVEIMPMNT